MEVRKAATSYHVALFLALGDFISRSLEVNGCGKAVFALSVYPDSLTLSVQRGMKSMLRQGDPEKWMLPTPTRYSTTPKN